MICLENDYEFRQVFQIHASSPFKILKETGVPAVIVSTKEESRKNWERNKTNDNGNKNTDLILNNSF